MFNKLKSLKVSYVRAFLASDGNMFQSFDAAVMNARSPSVFFEMKLGWCSSVP